MTAHQEDGADRQYEPSQRKLDEARRRGELPKSADLTTASAYLGLVAISAMAGGALLMDLATSLSVLLAEADGLSGNLFTSQGRGMTSAIGRAILPPLLPWILGPAALALASVLAQRAMVFAPEKLVPRLSRVSPFSNARNKFGAQGLFEFAKSFMKLAVLSALLGTFLAARLSRFPTMVALDPAIIAGHLLSEAQLFLGLVVVAMLVMSAPDLVWQHASHLRQNRMTRQELTDETKEMMGDPALRQKRRERATDIATNRMLGDVPGADVVIVNPRHYAVALTWDRGARRAPVCVAKGVDEIAARIREAAMAAGIPVRSDPPTARAVYATVEIGQEIAPEHYRAVAAAIRFADNLRRRAKRPFR